MEDDIVWNLAGEIPLGWYGGLWDEFESMIRQLLERRAMVRNLIEAFRVSARRSFPAWDSFCERYAATGSNGEKKGRLTDSRTDRDCGLGHSRWKRLDGFGRSQKNSES
jgi:hypothetical protein